MSPSVAAAVAVVAAAAAVARLGRAAAGAEMTMAQQAFLSRLQRHQQQQ